MEKSSVIKCIDGAMFKTYVVCIVDDGCFEDIFV